MSERQTPYSAAEKRVCEYLQQITQGAVGCGDDPVGFLIASHQALGHLHEQDRKAGHKLLDRIQELEHGSRVAVFTNDPATDFLFIFGMFLGSLSRSDVRDYLLKYGVTAEEIDATKAAAFRLMQAFYR